MTKQDIFTYKNTPSDDEESHAGAIWAIRLFLIAGGMAYVLVLVSFLF